MMDIYDRDDLAHVRRWWELAFTQFLRDRTRPTAELSMLPGGAMHIGTQRFIINASYLRL